MTCDISDRSSTSPGAYYVNYKSGVVYVPAEDHEPDYQDSLSYFIDGAGGGVAGPVRVSGQPVDFVSYAPITLSESSRLGLSNDSDGDYTGSHSFGLFQPAPTISMEQATYDVFEGESASITIKRTEPIASMPWGAVTVRYVVTGTAGTNDVTGFPPGDYGTIFTATIPAGQLSTTINLTATDDGIWEGTKEGFTDNDASRSVVLSWGHRQPAHQRPDAACQPDRVSHGTQICRGGPGVRRKCGRPVEALGSDE
jgi:hypothetical protein